MYYFWNHAYKNSSMKQNWNKNWNIKYLYISILEGTCLVNRLKGVILWVI